MVRASHIPVEVRSAASKKAVREAAESALLHGPGMGSPEARAAFERMSEPHRIAVCLTAMQGFAELLAGIAAKGGEGPNEYTDKFFGLLDSVSIDHAAARNPCAPIVTLACCISVTSASGYRGRVRSYDSWTAAIMTSSHVRVSPRTIL